MRSKSIGWIMAALLTCSRVELASAHHSFAAFDTTRQFNLTGVVKEFQWTNPHCWVQVLVAINGEDQEWSVQMGPPSNLYRDGWRPSTLKVGDTIIVVVHPMRDGTHGGLWISGSDAHGKAFGADSQAK